ncbi:MAG: glycosyl transferase family 1, partial [Chloroflexi bacterium]|nr:glycosyl transferase family 1 [Chloroflexota bacterium]
MHLLILTPQFPYPPHQGTTLRNYHLIRHLAERHVIDLFSLLARGDDPGAEPVQKLVRHLVTAPQPARTLKQRLRDLFLSPLPDMALRLWDEAAFARLRAHIEAHPPDVVQVEGIEMAPYLLALQQAGVALPRVV